MSIPWEINEVNVDNSKFEFKILKERDSKISNLSSEQISSEGNRVPVVGENNP